MKEDATPRPVLGITLGDFNGVGPEVILKAFADKRVMRFCTPVVYGPVAVLAAYRELLGGPEVSWHRLAEDEAPRPEVLNVREVGDGDHTPYPGEVTEAAGACAFASIERATQDALAGRLAGLVTAPINKQNIQREGFNFPGHTEFFTQAAGARESLMLLCSDALRVGVVTGHVALRQVPDLITTERLKAKLKILETTLRQDFGIAKPTVAVLGLNPHAGERGLLGREETEVIGPLVEGHRHRGQLVFGPYPADGFFGTMQQTKFDGVLAMYHDQGLVPFKTLAFASGVNYTAGLSIVRTSPDHGTAYDLAGKNQADPTSMRSAIFLAASIAKRRQAVVA